MTAAGTKQLQQHCLGVELPCFFSPTDFCQLANVANCCSHVTDAASVISRLLGACCDYLQGSVPYALTVQLLITQNH